MRTTRDQNGPTFEYQLSLVGLSLACYGPTVEPGQAEERRELEAFLASVRRDDEPAVARTDR
jgi:hypothetical protein